MEPKLQSAFEEMARLEAGEVANRDEGRMVGHYWLRAPQLAPTAEIRSAISLTLDKIKAFTRDVHSGQIGPRPGVTFSHILIVGIGGSALGPQFANQALSACSDPMRISFFDNTDPDGMAKTLFSLAKLEETLVIVISKSGEPGRPVTGNLLRRPPLRGWIRF